MPETGSGAWRFRLLHLKNRRMTASRKAKPATPPTIPPTRTGVVGPELVLELLPSLPPLLLDTPVPSPVAGPTPPAPGPTPEPPVTVEALAIEVAAAEEVEVDKGSAVVDVVMAASVVETLGSVLVITDRDDSRGGGSVDEASMISDKVDSGEGSVTSDKVDSAEGSVDWTRVAISVVLIIMLVGVGEVESDEVNTAGLSKEDWDLLGSSGPDEVSAGGSEEGIAEVGDDGVDASELVGGAEA